MTTTAPAIPPKISFLIQAFFFIFYSRALESFYSCIDKLFSLSDFLSAVSRSVILLTILLTFPFMMFSNSITFEFRLSTLVFAFMTLICSAIFIRILSSDRFEDSYYIPLEIIVLAVGTEGPSKSTMWLDLPTLLNIYFALPVWSTRSHWKSD